MRATIRRIVDLAAWPLLTTGAALLEAIDGGRTLRWVRNTHVEYEADVIA